MRRTTEEINFFRDCDFENLLWREKLHLVLDLDHTLIHARCKTLLTLEDKQRIRNCKHKLHKISKGTHVVKLRPGVDLFLREASTMFDLSIFTMGKRPYTERISRLLEDCCGNEFRFGKVVSREDCAIKGQKSIDIVMSDERVVVIVDDTRGVWMSNEANLVQIAPYNFFTTNQTDTQPKLEGLEGAGAMDEELARVLRTLRSIHSVFFYGHDAALDKDQVFFFFFFFWQP
ncbi:RNA polymerase II C-terminal domain phosphatase-like 4 [Silene latifolia]|uniref:RNA polymerase II C-terminal domain phosphatase-like 4 n=1 Tax=Silene latifolia TaxID=37657 RepID=UPI003D776B9D